MNPQLTALVYDRDASHRSTLTETLGSAGFEVVSVSDPGALDAIESSAGIDFALIDIDSGSSLLTHPAVQQAIEVILMSSEDDHVRVNQGISQGATSFFCKPFDERYVLDIARDIAEEKASRVEQEPQPRRQARVEQFGLLRGSSPAIRKIYRTIRKVAPLDTTVFVNGESGTGKDLVAQTLQMMSSRADKDFVAVNCASIPRELFESELFGHEKGSFSGAVNQHAGFFERADGGTLFLDEITEMPVELQAKLLRVLETNAYRRVGAEEDFDCNVRIIASSNRRPEEAISDRLLRQDLYFRIARFQISIPPLRQRGEDITGLALFFLDELNQQYSSNRTLSQDALDLMMSYPWPGNVREMQSAIERAFILTTGEITANEVSDLQGTPEMPGDRIEVSKSATIAEAERKLILAVLEDCNGNKSRAAESLGISLKTLYNRLNEYNLDASS